MLSLGFSFGMHDAAACIVDDGQIAFAVAEERLSRVKHDGQFPERAIRACLGHVGAEPDDLDFVSVGWSPPFRQFRHEAAAVATGKYPLVHQYSLNAALQFIHATRHRGGLKDFSSRFGAPRARLRYVDHHLAHAISSYGCSGFDEATVLVVDGRGAWEATSIWHARDGRLEPVETIPWPNSVGLFYAEFTYYLGFAKYSDEWKVMGLAPYGRPGIDLSPFIQLDSWPYRVAGARLLGRDAWDTRGISSLLGPRRQPESELTQGDMDLAFAVQQASERAMVHIVEHAIAKTGCRNLCLAGGVALNAKANGLLARSDLVDRIFIQPASGDDGVAIGAALSAHLEADGRLPRTRMRQAYLGPAYDDEIESTLRAYKVKASRVSTPGKAAAEMLEQGKIVGWYQGRMEFGPRALGGRSILADPRQVEIRDRVNTAVKFREPWRPFAPSFLAEHAGPCLEGDADSPFMIQIVDVRPEWRDRLAAVTHVDGTTRPQTVEEDVNPPYRELIEEFYRRTGVPAVLNTSFNLRGEPIVCTPTDALRTFFSSGMDALVLGEFVLEK